MFEALDYLFDHAELKIYHFDVSTRLEMSTFNRIRPHYVMSYHKEGSAKLRVEQETYHLSPGTVICIPPYVEHDHYKDTNEKTVFLWWHIKYEIGSVIDVLKLCKIPLVFQLRNASRFESVFNELMEIYSDRDSWPSKILKKAKALELLYLLMAEANTEKYSAGSTQMEGFLDILIQIIKHPEQELSLKAISEQLYMHPTYISNRFKELFGKSPIRLHREMRIHQAKKLLGTSEMSATEIAESLGLSLSSFSRLFQLYVGVSPTRYRELNKMWG